MPDFIPDELLLTLLIFACIAGPAAVGFAIASRDPRRP